MDKSTVAGGGNNSAGSVHSASGMSFIVKISGVCYGRCDFFPQVLGSATGIAI